MFVNGAFIGITTKRKTALAHKAKQSHTNTYMTQDFDPEDNNWVAAKKRGLISEGN